MNAYPWTQADQTPEIDALANEKGIAAEEAKLKPFLVEFDILLDAPGPFYEGRKVWVAALNNGDALEQTIAWAKFCNLIIEGEIEVTPIEAIEYAVIEHHPTATDVLYMERF